MRFVVFAAAALVALVPGAAGSAFVDGEIASILAGHPLSGLQGRQTAATNSTTATTTTTTTNSTMPEMAAWDRATSEICAAHLLTLDTASNPSGMAICYNVPMLNNQTGQFLADLRLYKISEPTGSFVGVRPSDVQVGLEYTGAMASRVTNVSEATTMTSPSKRSAEHGDGVLHLGTLPVAATVARRDSNPQLLETYLFVGKIDSAKIDSAKTESALEALIMPTLTLSAVNPAGQSVTTRVSLNEASFLIGVFADLTLQSAFGKAADRVRVVQQLLAQDEIAFVLPGVDILVFPIGLIVTSVWLAIGVAAYGFGTYQRYCYAHSFKSRQARLAKASGKTF